MPPVNFNIAIGTHFMNNISPWFRHISAAVCLNCLNMWSHTGFETATSGPRIKHATIKPPSSALSHHESPSLLQPIQLEGVKGWYQNVASLGILGPCSIQYIPSFVSSLPTVGGVGRSSFHLPGPTLIQHYIYHSHTWTFSHTLNLI